VAASTKQHEHQQHQQHHNQQQQPTVHIVKGPYRPGVTQVPSVPKKVSIVESKKTAVTAIPARALSSTDAGNGKGNPATNWRSEVRPPSLGRIIDVDDVYHGCPTNADGQPQAVKKIIIPSHQWARASLKGPQVSRVRAKGPAVPTPADPAGGRGGPTAVQTAAAPPSAPEPGPGGVQYNNI
jgi:hypothetical protein